MDDAPVFQPKSLLDNQGVSHPSAIRGITAYNGHFGCTCYHPLFCFNQFGNVEQSLLRDDNVHGAQDWRAALEPVVARYQGRKLRRYFRADVKTPATTEEASSHGLEERVKRHKSQRSDPFAKENRGRIGKKTCRPMGQEENHEKGPRRSWA